MGLSIGSTDALSSGYLDRLADLIDEFEPMLVSDHLCWNSVGGIYANDLLPLPCTEEALELVVERVERVQQRLRRTLLLENPSSYLRYVESTIPESEFLAEVSRRSGCGVLLDLNNVVVTTHNHGGDAQQYLASLPPPAVRQFHLAGHVRRRYDDGDILIDTHSRAVGDHVWALYRAALAGEAARA